jgi:hypothetical protein
MSTKETKPKRFSYSTVGYGIFTLLGERYRCGRIEVYDEEDLSGYAVAEGMFCLPYEVSQQIEDFFESLETDLPLYLNMGSISWCKQETAKALGIELKDMDDPDFIKEYYGRKGLTGNDE